MAVKRRQPIQVRLASAQVTKSQDHPVQVVRPAYQYLNIRHFPFTTKYLIRSCIFYTEQGTLLLLRRWSSIAYSLLKFRLQHGSESSAYSASSMSHLIEEGLEMRYRDAGLVIFYVSLQEIREMRQKKAVCLQKIQSLCIFFPISHMRPMRAEEVPNIDSGPAYTSARSLLCACNKER